MCCLRVPLDSSEGWRGKRQESGRNAAHRLSKTPGDEGGISVPWTLTPDTIQGGSKILKTTVAIGFYIRVKIWRKFATRKWCWNSVIINVMVMRSHFASGYLILGSVDSGGGGDWGELWNVLRDFVVSLSYCWYVGRVDQDYTNLQKYRSQLKILGCKRVT